MVFSMTTLLQTAASLLVTVLALSLCHAERDPNAPWGNKPPKKFRMFWKDASNVLEDLTEFQYLYINFHGCVWSEYGIDNFDDDGEYRDGDENWYQGRTTSFRANAAYSLYGELKGKPRWGRKCAKQTYINTFFTYMGADTIVDALGLGSNNDDGYGYGHAYCSEANYADDDSAASTTMGCSLSNPNEFAMAIFSDDDCDGNYFLNTTDNDSMDEYNAVIESVKCEKVWDYSKDYSGRRLEDYSSSSSTYGSVAETILQSSLACDLDIYQGRCPDPYGIKRKYENAVTGNVFRVRFSNAIKRPLRILSTIALLVGIGLVSFVYYHKNKKQVHRVIDDISTKASGLLEDDTTVQDNESPSKRNSTNESGLLKDDIAAPDVESPSKRTRSRGKKRKKKQRIAPREDAPSEEE